jgi:predicted transglutaminase-like cysteine proteinase
MIFTMKNSLKVLVIATVLIIAISCTHQKDRTYSISETYKISSKVGSTTFLVVDLPISYGYQIISDIVVENANSISFANKYDYQTAYIELVSLDSETEIKISYNVVLLAGLQSWEGEISEEYLKPSEFIDSDSELVTEIANLLKDKNDPFITARNISEFVNKTIKFRNTNTINAEQLKASEILAVREGVCGDYTIASTALLRAAGIPAKDVSGLVFHKLKPVSSWSSPGGSHAWVEFYIDGKWHFDDPTWSMRYFKNPDGYHLSYGSQVSTISSIRYRTRVNELVGEGYNLIGAMTSPIKFISWSNDENAKITPFVSIIEKK